MSHAESHNTKVKKDTTCMPEVFWEGDIEKTNFEQVIFSPCGRVFKKGVGWDGKSSWMIFDRKDGIFQWVLSDKMENVVSALQASESVVLNINSLWWNFYDWPENHGGAHIKIFNRYSSGEKPCEYDLKCGGGSEPIIVKEFGLWPRSSISPFNNDFYNNAYSLKALPIYNSGGGGKTWEDYEGWTHCLEEPDWVEDLLSEQEQEEEHSGSLEEQSETQEQEEDLMKKK